MDVVRLPGACSRGSVEAAPGDACWEGAPYSQGLGHPAWPPRRALGIVEPQDGLGDLSSGPHSLSLAVSSSGQGPCPSILGQGWAAAPAASLGFL